MGKLLIKVPELRQTLLSSVDWYGSAVCLCPDGLSYDRGSEQVRALQDAFRHKLYLITADIP